jgi:hypothetical protein
MPRVKVALYSGVGAALSALTAIALLSRREGHRAVRPVNATSHVIWGPRDATREDVDIKHTLPGLAINVVSAFFWAGLFAMAAPVGPKRSAVRLVATAFGTSLLAAVVDYKLVPRRLRPGWEHALGAPSVAIALATMGAGLAIGGSVPTRDEAPEKSEAGE